MNIRDVMTELATALGGVTGLRVFDLPPTTLTPPAGVIGYPESLDFHPTTGAQVGALVELPATMIAGRVTDRSARDTASAWADSGAVDAVRAAIEAGTYASCDTVTVKGCTFETVAIGTVEYLAVTFDLHISGH
jgi:hypothetical protein